MLLFYISSWLTLKKTVILQDAVLLTSSVQLQNYKNCTACPETLERAINLLHPFCKKLQWIFCMGDLSPTCKIFIERLDVCTFYRPIRKNKVLNESFNRLVYKFYLQSILILEEYLLKRWNASLIMPLDVFWSIL